MITPSGRFQINTRLCLSISDFHPDTWNPSWTVSTIIMGLISFMNGKFFKCLRKTQNRDCLFPCKQKAKEKGNKKNVYIIFLKRNIELKIISFVKKRVYFLSYSN